MLAVRRFRLTPEVLSDREVRPGVKSAVYDCLVVVYSVS